MTDEKQDSLAGDPKHGLHPMRLYSIPAGVEFIPQFVTALLAQKIIPGFPDAADPLALSTARIFVPTRRAARAMASEIARQLGANSAILPQILPLGSLAEAEEASLFDPVAYAGFAAVAAQEAMPELERRLLLTELIIGWGRQIRHAILSVDENGRIIKDEQEAFVVTSAPGQAFHLAGELCDLIDEMIIEAVDWRALHKLAPENFDRYWSITLEFLKIAMEHWPLHLEQSGRVDAARRNVQLAGAEAERLTQTRPPDPYIVAGSTGTNAATAQLMAAIARLPNGAVVLPGLDHGLDAGAWAQLDKTPDMDGAAGHPQKALANLLVRLRAVREDVMALGAATGPIAARMEFLTQALLPAEATGNWNAYRKIHADGDSLQALAGVSYLDAGNERYEALAIAIALRQALETEGRTAALITPDRDLARRVRSELLRWDVIVDDSGGEILKNQPAGVLARIALELAQSLFGNDSDALSPGDPAVLVALFNHDHVRLGYDQAAYARIAQIVEYGIVRGPAIPLQDPQKAIAKARTMAEDRHAHRLKKTIDDQGWADAAAFLQKLQDALSPLTGLSGSQSLIQWFAALHAVYQALTSGDDGAPAAISPDTEALQILFDDFAGTPDTSLRLTLAEFAAFFDTAAQEARVRGPQNAHPRIKILGLLEARLLPADLKILAGMDEGVWPPAARADAFLNRPMREELGLSPPERRIGQTAHDFVEAMGAQEVIITRSRKRNGAPSIPSRLIQRMAALAGETAWSQCRARGDWFLQLAQALDRPAAVAAAPRPEPRPPVDLRPRQLSVTQIETWRRDPYSIYAARILQLQPLDEAGIDNLNADIGSRLHAVIEHYQSASSETETLEQAQARIAAIAEAEFSELLTDVNVRVFRWPRIITALEDFVAWEMQRRAATSTIAVEQAGAMDIPLNDDSTFTLTARADRIETLRDGGAALVDYKSSRTPSSAVIEAGFAPQLTLEAAIVEYGGFDCIPAGASVAEALYLALLGADGVRQNDVGTGKGVTQSLDELKRDHLEGLKQLANQFRQLDTAYVPRPYPQFTSDYGDYDHLARVKEWMGDAGGDDA